MSRASENEGVTPLPGYDRYNIVRTLLLQWPCSLSDDMYDNVTNLFVKPAGNLVYATVTQTITTQCWHFLHARVRLRKHFTHNTW